MENKKVKLWLYRDANIKHSLFLSFFFGNSSNTFYKFQTCCHAPCCSLATENSCKSPGEPTGYFGFTFFVSLQQKERPNHSTKCLGSKETTYGESLFESDVLKEATQSAVWHQN